MCLSIYSEVHSLGTVTNTCQPVKIVWRVIVHWQMYSFSSLPPHLPSSPKNNIFFMIFFPLV